MATVPTIARPSLSRRSFLAAPALAQQRRKKPNLLMILADDMGFSDAGCFGGEIETPNLDRLARGGLRFTQAYSTARCMPSRGALLSGFYSQQSGLEQSRNARPASWVRFLPQQLAGQGYRCYHSGKWHIAATMPVGDAGFHHSYFLGDQDRFFSPTRHHLNDEPLPAVKPDSGYYATTEIGTRAAGWLDLHRNENPEDPFFLYLAFTSPHFPLHALSADIARFKDRYGEGWDRLRERRWKRAQSMGLVNCKPAPLEPETWPPWNLASEELTRRIGPGEVTRAVPWKSLTAVQREFQATKMAIHAAMVYRMDQEIGRVLGRLESMGALEDTLILFFSDNGASAEQLIRADGHEAGAEPGSWRSHLCLGPGWSSAANSPFRLHKSWIHEGGISSPMIAHWPAAIRDRGKLRHTPCHLIDVLPTMVDVAGGKPTAGGGAPPYPGRSLAGAFSRDASIDRDYLFFHHLNNRGLREGDWKAVSAGDGGWELYDLARDRGETTNLASRHPDRSRAMAARWEKLEAEFTGWRK
ncbi:MAG: arylsulfatase [Bryobacteraceae bacterium]